MANTVKVTLIKSVSGRIPNHKLCVKGLGLSQQPVGDHHAVTSLSVATTAVAVTGLALAPPSFWALCYVPWLAYKSTEVVAEVKDDTLLLVRNHFGPTVLYEAADRAGILLVQCVPLSHASEPDVNVAQQVDRLAAHPSLAGWMVDHNSRIADRMANRIQYLDPTRQVFRDLPMAS